MNLSNKKFSDIVVDIVSDVSSYFITFIVGLTVVVFIWGIVKYIYKADSQAEREKGKNLMIWGLVGIFILFALWGILEVLGNTFGIDIGIPQFGG